MQSWASERETVYRAIHVHWHFARIRLPPEQINKGARVSLLRFALIASIITFGHFGYAKSGFRPTPWPRECVDRYGLPPVVLMEQQRDFEDWKSSLDQSCLDNWEKSLAELRAHTAATSATGWQPSRCESLRADVEQNQSDLQTAQDSVRRQNSICRWWTLPYECPPVLKRQLQAARTKLAQSQSAYWAARCKR